MNDKKVDIEEIIADARAEEEVAREQAAAKEKTFKDELREKLKETFRPREEERVTITLSEYVVLINKAMDLDRILNAIVDRLTLSYNNEYLVLGDRDKVVDAFRVLYPEAYDALLAAELERAENENEGE
jgi:hypothetical protein